MGELKIQYSNKKVTPFGGMKLLKDFIDKTDIIKDLVKDFGLVFSLVQVDIFMPIG